MKQLIMLVVLAAASSVWAQPAQKKEAAKPAVQETAKPAAMAKKSRRHEDARQCLERPSNTEIIKCAEEYL